MPLNLPANSFQRYDESPDANFYSFSRFVEHIDETAIAAVTQLYRDHFPANGAILDLMSSWVSHLPPEIQYARVVGLGMNQAELENNPRLTAYRVQDLNRFPELPYAPDEFDGAGICVSIQYLTNPVAVLRDVARVLKPNAPLLITFSNRCFPDKAVAIWQSLNDKEHQQLVAAYLQATENYSAPQFFSHTPHHRDPLYGVLARKLSQTGT